MTELVAVDIGGTHARFAVARISPGRSAEIGPVVTLKTAEHASFTRAWEAFAEESGAALPRAAAIAIAGPVGSGTDAVPLTNNPWMIYPKQIPLQLRLDRLTLVNDLGAVGHALDELDAHTLRHVCGPEVALPTVGVVTLVGPGTGLGVAVVHRTAAGAEVVETEGGHVDFAPLDLIDDAILQSLRKLHRRVSAERVVSGPGLTAIHAVLAGLEGRSVPHRTDGELWTAALDGSDSLAVAALDRFCLSLGALAGDLALAQGASAVVLAGGLGLRLADRLAASGFGERFRAKGRFERQMSALPVKVVTHAHPALLGAAAAFAAEHGADGP